MYHEPAHIGSVICGGRCAGHPVSWGDLIMPRTILAKRLRRGKDRVVNLESVTVKILGRMIII